MSSSKKTSWIDEEIGDILEETSPNYAMESKPSPELLKDQMTIDPTSKVISSTIPDNGVRLPFNASKAGMDEKRQTEINKVIQENM